jgi:hypothetical protein
MSYDKFLTLCNVTIDERINARTVSTAKTETVTITLGSAPVTLYGDPPANKNRERECVATFVFVNDKLESISR